MERHCALHVCVIRAKSQTSKKLKSGWLFNGITEHFYPEVIPRMEVGATGTGYKEQYHGNLPIECCQYERSRTFCLRFQVNWCTTVKN